MAHAGTTIENQLAGESLTFVATREDGSETLVCEIATLAGAPGPPEHMHPSSNELFEVQEGAITVEVDGVVHSLKTGQSLTVQAGAAHKFASDPELDGRTRVTFDVPGPARRR
jgi:quercetin dioxygenase-like cupin family protein